jgi:hypothetical protein
MFYNNQNIINMLDKIIPKLPMRDKNITRSFYLNALDFKDVGITDFDGYLLLQKDDIEIHFFEYKDIDIKENYGQVYIRTNNIEQLYQFLIDNKTTIHPNGHLELKPWGQKEFSILDPDHNLLTFGESL